jgi:hypothetical protein
MACCDSAGVTADTSRVIIVRAWRDAQRIIIRVLAGKGHRQQADEWVFADIDAACKQLADLLGELVEKQPRPRGGGVDNSQIQSVDAHAHRDPQQ